MVLLSAACLWSSMAVKVLERSDRNRVLAGVFGGLGEYLNVDPNILRLVGVILLLLAPTPMTVIYTFAALLVPRKGGVSYVSPSLDMSKTGPVIVGLVLFIVGLALMGSFPWAVISWPLMGFSLAVASLAGLVIASIGLFLLIDQLRKL
uniref:PspC domain-containing protein n=1 Tax=Caldiarchaeum subterraneum TaxID=311458 RepID=A0A7J3VU23_CALS0